MTSPTWMRRQIGGRVSRSVILNWQTSEVGEFGPDFSSLTQTHSVLIPNSPRTL